MGVLRAHIGAIGRIGLILNCTLGVVPDITFSSLVPRLERFLALFGLMWSKMLTMMMKNIDLGVKTRLRLLSGTKFPPM